MRTLGCSFEVVPTSPVKKNTPTSTTPNDTNPPESVCPGPDTFTTNDLVAAILKCLDLDIEDLRCKIVKAHSDLQILIVMMFQLGATYGHARSTEISRIQYGSVTQKSLSAITFRNFGQSHGTVMCGIKYSSKKANVEAQSQLMPEEISRCLALFSGVMCKIIVALMKNEKLKVVDRTSKTVVMKTTQIALVQLNFGFGVEYFGGDELMRATIDDDRCKDKLNSCLGTKDMTFRAWRQVRAALADSIGIKDREFFKALNQTGFSFKSCNRARASKDQRILYFNQKIHSHHPIHTDENTGYKHDVVVEFMTGVSDMCIVLPSNLSDADIYKLRKEDSDSFNSEASSSSDSSGSKRVSFISIVITPSLFLAKEKARQIGKDAAAVCATVTISEEDLLESTGGNRESNSEEQSTCSTCDDESTSDNSSDDESTCDDYLNEDPQVLTLDQAVKNEHIIFFFMTLEQASLPGSRKCITHHFKKRKVREMIFTDVPLAIVDDANLSRLQSLKNIDIVDGIRVCLMPTFGNKMDRKLAETICPQTVLSHLQSCRFQRLLDSGANLGDARTKEFLKKNGMHTDQSSVLEKLKKTRHYIYSTAAANGFQEKLFFRQLLEALSLEDSAGLAIIFVSNMEFTIIRQLAHDMKINDICAFLDSLSDKSLDSFNKALDDTTKICIAIPEAAYAVKYLLHVKERVDDNITIIAYQVYAGLVTYLQCILCQGEGTKNRFYYVHDEGAMRSSESSQNTFEMAKQIFAGDTADDHLSNRTHAEMLCECSKGKHPTSVLAKKLFDVDLDIDIDSKPHQDTTQDAVHRAFACNLTTIENCDNKLQIAECLSRDDHILKEERTKKFLDTGYLAALKLTPGQISTEEKTPNYSSMGTNNMPLKKIIATSLRNDHGFEGMRNCCCSCCLPFGSDNCRKGETMKCLSEYRSSHNFEKGKLRNGCGFDRRNYLHPDNKDKCCDCCYVYRDYQPNELATETQKEHSKKCAEDLLFIFVVIVFGSTTHYNNFVKKIPRAKDATTKMIFKDRNAKSVEQWAKNLTWITSSSMNNLDFWYFVSIEFEPKPKK